MSCSFIGDGMIEGRHIKRFRASEGGAVLLEFLLVMPLMFLMLAVIMDFGRIFWGYQSLTAGVRDASRYLARVAPVDICVTGGSLASYKPTLSAMIEDDIGGTSVLPGGFTIDSVEVDYTCVTGSFRTSPAAVATVSANVSVEFALANFFAVNETGVGNYTATITDETKVYGQ